MLDPTCTYMALLVTQALHLRHHRLAIRHISFAEVVSVHVFLIAVQVAGSLWIRKLSPDWSHSQGKA